MMKQKANEADQESDLREAFKIFDREYEKIIINNIVEITYLQQGWIYRFEGAENGSHHVGLYAHQGGGGGVYARGRCSKFSIFIFLFNTYSNFPSRMEMGNSTTTNLSK